MYPSEPRRRAFTLIEMLVVIAIIGLLAAIIVPAIGSTLDRSKTIKGQSNLRQIGLGFAIYATNNDGKIPYEQGKAGAVDRRTWHVAIAPFLTGFSLAELEANVGKRPVGVFACPRSKNLTRGGNYADYGLNIYINGHEDDQGGFQRGVIHIPEPGKVILAGDSLTCNRGLRPGATDGHLDRRHGKKDSANILYVDGHVATEAVDPLWKGISGNRQQQVPWGWPGWWMPAN